jgi:hypothetical protein
VEELRLLFIQMSENILTLNQEQINLEQRLAVSPSVTNLLEYAFRILTYFSEVNPSSQEGTHIRNELEKLSQQYSGGFLFTALEEYTIHILQNNTIEQYKGELRAKAHELLQIKHKLEEVINRQIEQEERMVNRPQPSSARPREPGNYTYASFSSTQMTPNSQR